MANLLPYLIKKAPDGSEERIVLKKTVLTLGRDPDNNDIPLPEYEGIITRLEHCVLERGIGGEWLLTDKKSTNGTILEREGQQIEVQSLPDQQINLGSGDTILIHGYELRFYDPERTNPLYKPTKETLKRKIPTSVELSDGAFVVNLSQVTLYKIVDGKRESIPMSPQPTKMLCCMAQKNLENQNRPTLCTNDELITAIWGEEYGYDSSHLADVRQMIRKKLKEYEGSPDLLETKKKLGCILHMHCEP